MTASELIRTAAAAIGGDTPRLDAEVLLAHALGTERLAMLAGASAVPPGAAEHFAAMVARRAAGEPVAYILGHRDFWTLRFAVDPRVLIPRPDSETLIEAAIDARAAAPPAAILDLGTGSGALLLAALDHWPGARGVGVDTSAGALEVARANAAGTGLASRAAFVRGDWGAGLAGPFDLILCNPPYVEDAAVLAPDVRREPASALFAGPEGLAGYRRVVPDLPRLLGTGGVAVLEAGAGQAAAVAALWPDGYAGARRDLGGHTRAVIFRLQHGL